MLYNILRDPHPDPDRGGITTSRFEMGRDALRSFSGFLLNLLCTADAEEPPSPAPATTPGLPIEINLHRTEGGVHLEPVLAYIPFRAAVAALSSFAPGAQHSQDLYGLAAPDKLFRKTGFTGCHPCGITRGNYRFDGFTD